MLSIPSGAEDSIRNVQQLPALCWASCSHGVPAAVACLIFKNTCSITTLFLPFSLVPKGNYISESKTKKRMHMHLSLPIQDDNKSAGFLKMLVVFSVVEMSLDKKKVLTHAAIG